jgi:hypothetical protein
MPDSIMYQEDAYVVLESDRPEQFLTAAELLEKLINILRSRPDSIPREVQKFATLTEQARHLRDNYCELEMKAGEYLQWYVVRLEK